MRIRHDEDMFPNASKIELFARKRRYGWDAVGDQLAATEPKGGLDGK